MTRHGKFLIAIAALSACGAGASRAAPFEVGLKAGATIATQIGSSIPDVHSITGLTAGVFTSFGLGPVALEPDVLFTAKGYKQSSTIGATAMTVINDYNYLEIPVLVKYVFNADGMIRPYLGLGPAIAFLMTAKAKLDLAGAKSTQDVKDALSSYDYSGVADVGLALGAGYVTLSLDVRYSVGFADISKTSGVNTKNGVTAIMAGVSF